MGYAQIDLLSGWRGQGEFINVLNAIQADYNLEDKLITHSLTGDEDILPCIQAFFEGGR